MNIREEKMDLLDVKQGYFLAVVISNDLDFENGSLNKQLDKEL